MPLKRLKPQDVDRFADYAELAMGLQLVWTRKERREFGYLLGDLVFMSIDEASANDLTALLQEPQIRRRGLRE